MDIIDQLKTPQGKIAVVDACVQRGEGAPWIDFALNGAVAASQPRTNGPVRSREATIEDLAFVDKESLVLLAKRLGPIFGAGARESVLDWQSAANVARMVMVVQEVVNGQKPLAVLGLDDDGQSFDSLIAKTQVVNAQTGNRFAIYAVSFAVDAAVPRGYVAHMPRMPWMKKFIGGGFDYVIADIEHDEDEGDFLTVTLLSFEKEITPVDFAAVLACYYDESRAASLLEEARAISSGFEGTVRTIDPIVAQGMLDAREASLSQDDLPQLQRLVQAIISLHLEGVRIDLFRSTEDDDFLSFDTYLSYLWFRFSKRLGQVKIGYCPVCGKAFSLAGHRGIPKKFCSEECKTAAKNERTRQQQADVRRAFIDGAGVGDIAKEFFPKQAAGVARDKVRGMLSQWVELKHMVDADIATGDGKLAKRCVAEGVFDEARIARRAKALRK